MSPQLLIPGLAILLAFAVVVARRARGVPRRREMRALARRMGWRFDARPPLDVVPDRKRLGLFTVRMHQRMRNHLSGQVGDVQVAVFDLEYSTTGRNGARRSEQTVAHLHAPRLDLPAFSVRSETVRHRLGDRVGGDDIDVKADPAFSHAYLLRGADEDAVRELFGRGVRDVFHRHRHTSTDAHGSDLLVWRRGRLAGPEEALILVQAALDLAAAVGRAARTPAGI